MKNIFGFLLLLRLLEDVFLFYKTVFSNPAELDWWMVTTGVVGTAVGIYLLFSFLKFAIKVVAFWNNPDPDAEIEL